MKVVLLIIQLIVSILLISVILLQAKGSGLSGVFGGEGGFYGTRRGIQQKIFYATVVFGVIFIILAILNLLI